MSKTKKPRKQCAKCPWRKDVDPHDIPNGYDVDKHCALNKTIAEPGALRSGALQIMACHETKPGKELACVGWIVQQAGPGNNIALRLALSRGHIDGNVETVGEQHERFEDTLPRKPMMKWCDEAKDFLDSNPGVDYTADAVANAVGGPSSGVRRALNALYDDNEIMALSGGPGPCTFRSRKAPSVDSWLKLAVEAETKWKDSPHRNDRLQIATLYYNTTMVAVQQHDILAMELIDKTEALYEALYPGGGEDAATFKEWRETWRFEEGEQ